VANNISYGNRKREAEEWKQRYEELAQRLGAESRMLEHSETLPRKSSKGARQVYNEVIDALNEYTITSPLPVKYVSPPKEGADESLALLLSDLHFGKLTEQDGQETYSIRIATERFKRIVSTAKYLYGNFIRSNHKIDDIHIFLDGDIIDGEQIYIGHEWNLEMPVYDQLRHATRIIGDELIAWASSNFNNVFVHSVQGNHGEVRGMGEPLAFHHSSNWDNIVSLMAETSARSLKNVLFDIGLDQFHVTKIPRHGKGYWTFMMMHKAPANQTISGTVNPIYGRYWQRTQFDMFLGAHWHNFSLGNFQGKPILHNGALFTDDEYTAKLGYSGFPSQTLFTIADKRPLALVWPINLEEEIQ